MRKGHFGFSSPIGLGIGIQLYEKEHVPEKNVGSLFPIYFYWAPLINWKEKEDEIIASSVLYFFFGFSNWAESSGSNGSEEIEEIITEILIPYIGENNYFRTGIGIHYSIFKFAPWLSISAEAGVIRYERHNYFKKYDFTTPYITIRISPISVWVPLVKKSY